MKEMVVWAAFLQACVIEDPEFVVVTDTGTEAQWETPLEMR